MNEFKKGAALIMTDTFTTAGGMVSARSLVPFTNSRIGVENPKYQALISSGGNATTAYSAEFNEFSSVYGSVSIDYWNSTTSPTKILTRSLGINGIFDSIGFDPNLTPDYLTSDNQALQKLVSDINKITMAWNGMEFFGEIRETISMLKTPLESLRKSIERYQADIGKLSKIRNIDRLKDALTGTYFEYVFGWAILVKDINSVLAIACDLTRKRSNLRVRSTGDAPVSRVSRSSTSNNWIAFDYDIIESVDVSTRYFVGFAPGTFSADATLARLYGLSPERFLPTVWEVIKLSWVVDYFANVGVLIEALTMPNWKPSYISKMVKVVKTKLYRPIFNLPSTISQSFGTAFISSTGQLGWCLYKKTTYTRTIPDKIPIPQFQVKLPDYWKNWLNMGVFAAQRTNLVKIFSKIPGFPRQPR